MVPMRTTSHVHQYLSVSVNVLRIWRTIVATSAIRLAQMAEVFQ